MTYHYTCPIRLNIKNYTIRCRERLKGARRSSTVMLPMRGTGKTTLLRMCKVKLKNEGFLCVFFNAWGNDFSSVGVATAGDAVSFSGVFKKVIADKNKVGIKDPETKIRFTVIVNEKLGRMV